MAISAVALSRQKVDALARAVQRLGLLLEAFVHAARPVAPGEASAPVASAPTASAPTASASAEAALAEAASEVGTAAQEVGARFVPTDAPSGAVRAPTRSRAAADATPAGDVFAPVAGPGVYARPGAPRPAGGGWARGAPPAGSDAAHPVADRDGRGPAGAPFAPAAGTGDPAADGHAAGALLRAAAELLAAVKLRFQAAPAPDPGGPAPPGDAGVMEHVARCEAQVAAAMAQVAGCSGRADGPDRARPGPGATAATRRGTGRRGGLGVRASPDAARPVRVALAVVLLCLAGSAVWAVSALDSAPARAACAAVAVAVCAARAWRALVPRLPHGSAVTVRPREGP